MPRQARIYFPGGIFHIISRCLNHEYLLNGATERRYYLGLLERTLRQTDARLLAWCIMSNHVHLVVRAGEAPLARLMKPLHSGYAVWKNRREGRIGPVFSERYKTVLVEQDAHLLELIRYVHLNPVRAGVTEHPDANDWSSHRGFAGLSKPPAWLDVGFVLEQFAEPPGEARQRYRSFIDDGLHSQRSPLLSGHETAPIVRTMASSLGELHRPSGPIVGSEDFVEEVLRAAGKPSGRLQVAMRVDGAFRPPPIHDLIEHVCDSMDLARETFDQSRQARRAALARRLVTRIWVQEFGGKQADLARHLDTSSAVVSRWHSRAVLEARSHSTLYERIVEGLRANDEKLRTERGEKLRRARKEQRTTVNIEVVREE